MFLVVSVVLATLYAREGGSGPLHAAQDAVVSVRGRVGSAGTMVGSATEAAGSALGDARASEGTLTALREQNAQLRSLVAETEEYRQEILRLRELLNMKRASGAEGPAARIIGRSGSAWDQSVTIDVGYEDGIGSGNTVLGSTGVIGQVTRAYAHTSTVRLLTDPNSGAAVIIQSSRSNAVVRGSIDGLLYLEDVEDDAIPVVGDVVLTSGLGGSYSSGLIVGTVVSVSKTASNATGRIIVSPNDDASVLEEVIVVTGVPSSTSSDAAHEELSGQGSTSSSEGSGE